MVDLVTRCFISANNHVSCIPGGLSGLFNMFGAYQHWCRPMSACDQFFEWTLEICGMFDDPECPKDGKHCEL